jgi:hypothetical protein
MTKKIPLTLTLAALAAFATPALADHHTAKADPQAATTTAKPKAANKSAKKSTKPAPAKDANAPATPTQK